MKLSINGIILLLMLGAAVAQDRKVDISHIGGNQVTGANLPVEIKKVPEQLQQVLTADSWGQSGSPTDVLDVTREGRLPRQMEICGRGLRLLTGTLFPRVEAEQYELFFPLTTAGTADAIPNEGCFSVTPLSRLRIRNFGSLTTETRPRLYIVLRY